MRSCARWRVFSFAIYALLLAIPCLDWTPCLAQGQVNLGQINHLEGSAKIKKDKQDFKAAKRWESVHLHDTLTTDPQSKLYLKISDKSHISLGQSSELYLSGFGRQQSGSYFLAYVGSGAVRFVVRVPETTPRSSYVITTPTAFIEVPPSKEEDSDFIVEVLNPAQTAVSVVKGQVTVKNILATFGPEINVENLSREVVVKACQRTYVDARNEPSDPIGVSSAILMALVEATTIDKTLPKVIPECPTSPPTEPPVDQPPIEQPPVLPPEVIPPIDFPPIFPPPVGPFPPGCPCPPGWALDPLDGLCKPCNFAAGAIYNPNSCLCECPCPPGLAFNPLDGSCVPDCPVEAPVWVDNSLNPDPFSLPSDGCPVCITCTESDAGCALSDPTDASCPTSPRCGACDRRILSDPAVGRMDDICDRCSDSQTGGGAPCALNVAGIPSADPCFDTTGAPTGDKCVAPLDCLLNEGSLEIVTDPITGAQQILCLSKQLRPFLARALCDECQQWEFGECRADKKKEGRTCRDLLGNCGECRDGRCTPLPDCPAGEKRDQNCTCVKIVPEEKPPPECTSDKECADKTLFKLPCCRDGACKEQLRCPDGTMRCTCEPPTPAPPVHPPVPPAEPPVVVVPPPTEPPVIVVPPPTQPPGIGIIEPPIACGPCQVRRGHRCIPCQELGATCDHHGRCVWTPQPCPRCSERTPDGRCVSCEVLGKICVSGRCVGKTDKCGPCQIRSGNLCISCSELGMQCVHGKCVKVDPCENVKCPPGQRCVKGRCIGDDPCANIKCPPGYKCVIPAHRAGVRAFVANPCVKIEPTDPCANVRCPPGHKCVKGKCVKIDSCANVRCPPGHKCVEGRCVKVDPCANVRCPPGHRCVNGKCVKTDPCANVTCPPGHKCVNGRCVKVDPCANVRCPPGHRCVNGKCVKTDPCANVTCPPGHKCVNGRCVKVDPCANVRCPPGHRCVGGRCEPVRR